MTETFFPRNYEILDSINNNGAESCATTLESVWCSFLFVWNWIDFLRNFSFFSSFAWWFRGIVDALSWWWCVACGFYHVICVWNVLRGRAVINTFFCQFEVGMRHTLFVSIVHEREMMMARAKWITRNRIEKNNPSYDLWVSFVTHIDDSSDSI